jgi:hypothetical protein
MTPGPDLTPGEQDRLRALLDEATADVHPHDGLDAIRSRTSRGNSMSSSRSWFLGTAAAVLATAATITVVAMVNGGDDPSAGPGPADTPTAAAESPTESPAESPAESPNESAPSPDEEPQAVEGAVPVYYVGDTGQGPRLFREFHPGIGADPLTQAVADAVSRTPDDPDYRTPWPDGTEVQASFDGEGDDGQISLNLSGVASDRPGSMSKAEAEMAVQQLVWTAQAATQTTAPVALRLDGQPTTTILGVPVNEPLARAAELDVLAQVWIIDPAEGATVEDGFTVRGVGSFFEANVVWELHRGGLDGPVVASQATTGEPVMAEECCRMAPYEFTVDLPDDAEPGEYTLRVHDEDMSDGEGFKPFEDTKTVVVE